MKNPNTKRKIRAVLIAAIFGAALFTATILLDNLAVKMGPHENLNVVLDFTFSILDMLAVFQTIPIIAVANAFGLQDSLFFQYFANGLLGAIIFTVIAIFWQLGKESKSETKN